MKTKKKSAFSKLMELAGNHKYFSYISFVLAVISAWIALIPFYDVWRIIKEIIEVRPDFNKAVHITSYGWQAVGFALLSMVFYIAALMCSHKAAFRVQANMRVYMMGHIMKLPLGYVESKGTGKIRKIVTDSSAATETYLAHNLPDKAVSYATPIGLLAMMAVFDWRLGLISLIPAVLAFVIMGTMMMGTKMAEDMKQYQNSLETMSSEAVEYVRGVPVLKTFGQTVFSFKRFKAAIDDYEKWTIDYTKAMMLPMIGFTVFSNAIFAALIIAVYALCGNAITDTFLLNLIFYILITATLTTTLMKVAYAGESQMIVEDALKRMDEILDVKELPDGTSDNKIKDVSVSLKNVKFSYDDAKTNAIDGISLDIKAGEHIAFVGPSGGGKTTLASLIARFWDVSNGSISIGGVDIKNIENKKLMDTVSYVFQDSRLLKTSILENVRMGRPDASDSEVIEALKKAQCSDIIDKLPEGVNTVIGSKGTYVSGGEMQRLSIARAFLKNAPILILDEATAFADPDNEKKVQLAFESLSKDKTVIMIAHRLSTVTNADCIYVLKDGKIAESGTHEALVDAGGVYTHMWNEYNKSVNWQVGKAGKAI
mgnify:FL=1